MVIAHNLTAMNASRQYGLVTSSKAKSTEKLSSGYKINRAADDAAGLTISEKMRSLVRGLNQGSDNIQDGISLVQIADGALSEVNDMLHRMTELSVKSANGTNTDADRHAIQQEINQIIQEIDKISEHTEYNTMPLFDKQKGEDDDGKVTKYVTSPAGETKSFSEAYKPAGATSYFVAASLDFSAINESNIDKIKDGYFSFRCMHGCGEIFKFKMVDIEGGSEKSSVTGRLNSTNHQYTINIHGLKSGEEVVNAIMDFVNNNKPSKTSTPYNDNKYGDMMVGHSQAMKAVGSKIIIYDPAIGSSSEKTTKDTGATYKGYIDASTLIKPEVKEPKNHYWIQCSNAMNDGIDVQTERMNSSILGVDKVDVSTELGAKDSISRISKAGDKVSSMRSELGAYQNRLEHAYDNNMNKAENTQAAESRIRDTDMAAEMVRLSMQNILQQAGEAMMSQANQSTQGVLSLLQ